MKTWSAGIESLLSVFSQLTLELRKLVRNRETYGLGQLGITFRWVGSVLRLKGDSNGLRKLIKYSARF